ncbi:hypothetical protein AA100600_0737 [Gluconobacter thailandicus F149-1 = NBRC 100600]|nr:hypothetical protein AA100600_0737 [Gluconobacter thailandicus F149-1 = NBRC 100600]
MSRTIQNLQSVPFFHDAAQIHDSNPVRHLSDNGQIMGNKDARHAQRRTQIPEQIYDLRLNRNIKRGDRLVRNQKIRPQYERTGDIQTLTLATRKFVWVSVGHRAGQSHLIQQVINAGANVLATMNPEGFGERLPYRSAGIKGRRGVLKDHLHPGTPRAQCTV